MLDAEVVGGVDLPGRRKSKKVRYDDECTVAIFELGMIFENAKEFRKALTKYVGVHTSQPASHNSQFTAGQSSQGSCHPEPTSSFQPGPTRFNQPASTTSNNHASSTTVCGDTSRVKRARETAKTSQPPPFVDTSIPVTRGITSQLPPKTRQTAGQKRGRVAIGEDSARGGPKRPSNIGFGIYTSASGTQILNISSSYKDASLTGIDLGFKPRGLRWKNKDAFTTSQLQQMANKKKK
uniref:Gag-pol polyprotein n=1 Tax=Solanum tuberosum TaxID=4113 RepID=M1C7I2_SOLTU